MRNASTRVLSHGCFCLEPWHLLLMTNVAYICGAHLHPQACKISITDLIEFVGTSSFGMSGINAHLILSSVQQTSMGETPLGGLQALQWQRSRCWPMARSWAMLHSASLKTNAVMVACKLTAARLAWLSDFRVSCLALHTQLCCQGKVFCEYLSTCTLDSICASIN